MYQSDMVEERFWNKVNKLSSCWEWIGSRYPNGYGQISHNNGEQYAHRMSWMMHNYNSIPKGWQICHHCDNPACVRPDHLFLGTCKDNVRDMIDKGRNIVNTGPALTQAAKLKKNKTHCKRGHEYLTENIKIMPNGARNCIKCIKFRGTNEYKLSKRLKIS